MAEIKTIQDVIAICSEKIKIPDEPALTCVMDIDGLACSGKTTLIQRMKTLHKIPTTKVQHVDNIKSYNTFFPAMLGYMEGGIVNTYHLTREFTISDRSLLNPLEWYCLWKIMSSYNRAFKNAKFDTNNIYIRLFEMEAVDIFETLKNSFIYKNYRKYVNPCILIDTRRNRCEERMRNRNIGTDYERSFWKFYVPLQNLMYKTLYDGFYIDLNWFGDLDLDIIMSGLTCFCEMYMYNLKMRYKPPIKNTFIVPHVIICDYDDEDNDDSGEDDNNYYGMGQIKRTKEKDYTLLNYTSNFYRSYVKSLANRALNVTPTDSEYEQYNCLHVSRICDLNGDRKIIKPTDDGIIETGLSNTVEFLEVNEKEAEMEEKEKENNTINTITNGNVKNDLYIYSTDQMYVDDDEYDVYE